MNGSIITYARNAFKPWWCAPSLRVEDHHPVPLYKYMYDTLQHVVSSPPCIFNLYTQAGCMWGVWCIQTWVVVVAPWQVMSTTFFQTFKITDRLHTSYGHWGCGCTSTIKVVAGNVFTALGEHTNMNNTQHLKQLWQKSWANASQHLCLRGTCKNFKTSWVHTCTSSTPELRNLLLLTWSYETIVSLQGHGLFQPRPRIAYIFRSSCTYALLQSRWRYLWVITLLITQSSVDMQIRWTTYVDLNFGRWKSHAAWRLRVGLTSTG